MCSFVKKHLSHKLVSFLFMMVAMISLVGCSDNLENEMTVHSDKIEIQHKLAVHKWEEKTEETGMEIVSTGDEQTEEKTSNETKFKITDVPKYAGSPYVEIHKNVPYFSEIEMQTATSSFEYYTNLDALGRCGTCIASIGQDIMPTEERGEIGEVRPTGWRQNKYLGLVEGNYLYNRCHLIGYQLTGENANAKNLITGTRYFNTEGMLPFENMVADYVRETSNHVLYRVTPIFQGDNLLADGVLIEAKSVEDNGSGILFCVFVYNIQPGIKIDYAIGENELEFEKNELGKHDPIKKETGEGKSAYAVNQGNGKIHIIGACSATRNDDRAMKHPVYFNTYEEAEAYSIKIAPDQKKRKCGNCW